MILDWFLANALPAIQQVALVAFIIGSAFWIALQYIEPLQVFLQTLGIAMQVQTFIPKAVIATVFLIALKPIVEFIVSLL